MWILTAALSAFFAGITSILAKIGIRKTDSDLATAIRTMVVLLFSWIMVLATGSAHLISSVSLKSLAFLALSGFATGASWLCYFKALSMADVNKVVPVDKFSTILTVFLAIVLFDETNHLAVKLIGSALLGIGILMMIEKKTISDGHRTQRGWIIYAVLAAVFAALTSIFAKFGTSDVESNLGTAIRTIFVLAISWIIVFARNKQGQLRCIDRRELSFILLSGIATGIAWLCYYHAIHHGIVSVVVPIDKMSILVAITFSHLFLGERLSRKAFWGLCLMVAGTLAMVLFA